MSIPLQRLVSSATVLAALPSLREPTITSVPDRSEAGRQGRTGCPVPPKYAYLHATFTKSARLPICAFTDETRSRRRTVDTLLAFLTTSCSSCHPFWEMLAEPGFRPRLGGPLVVVTPSRSMEDERRALELMPDGAHLHMGSETWFEYGIGTSASFVLVRGPKDGPPPWEQARPGARSASARNPDELLELVKRWRAGAPDGNCPASLYGERLYGRRPLTKAAWPAC